MLITKEFTFAAAHRLTEYRGKCENMHGHTYKLHVSVEGEIRKDGLVIDFVDLKNFVKERVINKLDHSNLNDLFENPTTELIAKWIWTRLNDIENVKLKEIKLWESPVSFVTYNGD